MSTKPPKSGETVAVFSANLSKLPGDLPPVWWLFRVLRGFRLP